MAAAARGDGAGVRSGAGRTGTGREAARHDASRRALCAGACASVWRRRAYHVLADPADGRLPGAHGEQLSYATRKLQRRARARVVGAAWVWVGLRWAPGARQLWGARLRVDHRPDGALASSAELSGSAEPSGRAVAASPGCRTRRHVSARRRRCAQSSCATETSSRPASERTEHLLELRNTSPAARARQSGLAGPLEPKVDEARVRLRSHRIVRLLGSEIPVHCLRRGLAQWHWCSWH